MVLQPLRLRIFWRTKISSYYDHKRPESVGGEHSFPVLLFDNHCKIIKVTFQKS
jgi:hypothetical protein